VIAANALGMLTGQVLLAGCRLGNPGVPGIEWRRRGTGVGNGWQVTGQPGRLARWESFRPGRRHDFPGDLRVVARAPGEPVVRVLAHLIDHGEALRDGPALPLRELTRGLNGSNEARSQIGRHASPSHRVERNKCPASRAKLDEHGIDIT
jgi:hypothetical protein